MGAHGVEHDLGEVLVGPVTAGEPDQREGGGQQAAVGQVVQGRHDLLARQVPGDTEQNQAAGTGDPWEALVPRVTQGVLSGGDPGGAHVGPPAAEMVAGSPAVSRPRMRVSWARPASCSTRCSRRTGRPWSASTWASPPA